MARAIITTILVVFTLVLPAIVAAQMPQCFRHCWIDASGQRRCALVCN